jgi:hypothetical protein
MDIAERPAHGVVAQMLPERIPINHSTINQCLSKPQTSLLKECPEILQPLNLLPLFDLYLITPYSAITRA